MTPARPTTRKPLPLFCFDLRQLKNTVKKVNSFEHRLYKKLA